MPNVGGGNGGSAVFGTLGLGVVAAVVGAVALDWLGRMMSGLMETILPYVFVILGVGVAVYSYSTLNNDISNGGGRRSTTAAPARQQLTRAPPPSRGRPSSGSSAARAPQTPEQQQLLQRRSGSGRQLLALAADESGALSASGSADSSTALVPASQGSSTALAESNSLSCPKPLGCGYRHVCPDTGRKHMLCDKHGRHPAPPPGSVWREMAASGQLRLYLSWEGRVLDVTAMGTCRGWDRELSTAVGALLSSGMRVSAMCSRSSSYLRLQKLAEVAAMDYRTAQRSKRVWGLFEKWLRRGEREQGAAASATLVIEMTSSEQGG